MKKKNVFSIGLSLAVLSSIVALKPTIVNAGIAPPLVATIKDKNGSKISIRNMYTDKCITVISVKDVILASCNSSTAQKFILKLDLSETNGPTESEWDQRYIALFESVAYPGAYLEFNTRQFFKIGYAEAYSNLIWIAIAPSYNDALVAYGDKVAANGFDYYDIAYQWKI